MVSVRSLATLLVLSSASLASPIGRSPALRCRSKSAPHSTARVKNYVELVERLMLWDGYKVKLTLPTSSIWYMVVGNLKGIKHQPKLLHASGQHY
jgi:hypothetical protein